MPVGSLQCFGCGDVHQTGAVECVNHAVNPWNQVPHDGKRDGHYGPRHHVDNENSPSPPRNPTARVAYLGGAVVAQSMQVTWLQSTQVQSQG